MAAILETALKLKIWKDTRGQDFVEHALIAGFVVLLFCAISPSMSGDVLAVFSKVTSSLDLNGGTSGLLQ